MDPVAIRETTLRELVSAGSVRRAKAVGQIGGFVVMINIAPSMRVLASSRGSVRVFPNLTTLASYLLKVGIPRFEVDAAGYLRGRVRKPRPDRAMALKGTRTRPVQPHLFEART